MVTIGGVNATNYFKAILQTNVETDNGGNTIVAGDSSNVFSVGSNNTVQVGDDSTALSYGRGNTISAGENAQILAAKTLQVTAPSAAAGSASPASSEGATLIGGVNASNYFKAVLQTNAETDNGDNTIVAGNNSNVFSVGSGSALQAGDDSTILSYGRDNAIFAGNRAQVLSAKPVQMASTSSIAGSSSSSNTSGSTGADANGRVADIFIPSGSKGISAGSNLYDVVGSNGERIQFDYSLNAGESYDVFSGSGIQVVGNYINSPFEGTSNIVGSTRINIGDDVLDFDLQRNAKLNGEEIAEGSRVLGNGAKITFNGGALRIESQDRSGRIDIKAEGQLLGKEWMSVDPVGIFSNPSGLLGKAISENRVIPRDEALREFNMANQQKTAQEQPAQQPVNPFATAFANI